MLMLLNYLALTIPGADGEVRVEAPADIPTGGLEEGQAGSTLIQGGIQLFILGTIIVSLFFLVFGGVKWIMSQGDKTKLDSARKTIIYAIVGLILTFLSFTIITVVGQMFSVDLLNTSEMLPSDCAEQGPC